MNLRSRSARPAALAAALATTLGLSACQLASPITTDMRYSAADGVMAEAGQLKVRDLLVISNGDGGPGVLSGLAVNESDEEVTLALSVTGPAGEPTMLQPTLELAPGESVRLDGMPVGSGPDTETIMLETVERRPGLGVPVRVRAAGDVGTADAPILLPRGPYAAFTELVGEPDLPELEHDPDLGEG